MLTVGLCGLEMQAFPPNPTCKVPFDMSRSHIQKVREGMYEHRSDHAVFFFLRLPFTPLMSLEETEGISFPSPGTVSPNLNIQLIKENQDAQGRQEAALPQPTSRTAKVLLSEMDVELSGTALA